MNLQTFARIAREYEALEEAGETKLDEAYEKLQTAFADLSEEDKEVINAACAVYAWI